MSKLFLKGFFWSKLFLTFQNTENMPTIINHRKKKQRTIPSTRKTTKHLSSKKNETVKTIVLDAMEKYPRYAEEIINIYLVACKARNAMLIETARLHSDPVKANELIHFLKTEVLQPLHLVSVYDQLSLPNYPRYFVVQPHNQRLAQTANNHKKIGELLGMYCGAGEMEKKGEEGDRLTGQIIAKYKRGEFTHRAYLYAETCAFDNNLFKKTKLEQSLQEKVINWNQALHKIGIECEYNMETYLTKNTLLDHADNQAFVTANLFEYTNFLWNCGINYERVGFGDELDENVLNNFVIQIAGTKFLKFLCLFFDSLLHKIDHNKSIEHFMFLYLMQQYPSITERTILTPNLLKTMVKVNHITVTKQEQQILIKKWNALRKCHLNALKIESGWA